MADIEFEGVGSSFFRCAVTTADGTYSSGVLLDRPLSDHETRLALQAVGAAFDVVQRRAPRLLHAEVAARLPGDADPSAFAGCELMSLSAVWESDTGTPSISLAYGFDDGVYAFATMRDQVIVSVSLND